MLKKSDNTGKNLLGKGVHFLKRDVIIFAFFLILSFLFWYLNSLRKEIEIDVRYPVKYLASQGSRITGIDLPDRLIFNLRGPGYSVIKLKLSGDRSPVSIDFSKVTLKRVPESQPQAYYLVTGTLIPYFSRQLRTEFQIFSIKPDTIFVTFEKKAQPTTSGKGFLSPGIKRKK